MLSFDKLKRQEAEHTLQLIAGVEPYRPVEPFVHTLLAAFEHWRLDSLSEVLAHPRPLLGLAQGARSRGKDAERALIQDMNMDFHFDRNHDPTTLAMTEEQKSESMARKRRAALKQEAREAWERLRGISLPAFHAKYRELEDPDSLFADYVEAHPTSLPSSYISERFAREFSEVMARREPGGGGARKLESSFYDYAHLGVGAAYCDVFTCDILTAECLGDAPEKIDRQAPIVMRKETGGAAGFVAALAAARK